MEDLEKILKNLTSKELIKAKKLFDKYYKLTIKKNKNLIDTYINSSGIYFRLEKVLCNKNNCKKCHGNSKEGHGPYWYSYKNGKREYVGKKRKKDLDKIQSHSKMIKINKLQNPYDK